MPVLRNARPELLKLFDVANEHESTSSRGETTIPSQALFLLNSPFVRSQAGWLASRVWDASHDRLQQGDDWRDFSVESAYRIVLGRPPTENELQRAAVFLTNYLHEFAETLVSQHSSHESDQFWQGEYEKSVRNSRRLVFYQKLSGLEFNDSVLPIQILSPALANSQDSALSIELWIRPTSGQSSTVLSCRSSDQPMWKISIEGDPENSELAGSLVTEYFTPDSGGRRNTGQAGLLQKGTWHHVVTTYDGATRRVYIDGQLVDECAITAPITASLPELNIGSTQESLERFSGQIDQIAIYGESFEKAVVQEHYQAFSLIQTTRENPAEFSALLSLCQSLMCSNEFIFLE